MLEDTNSLDAAHMLVPIIVAAILERWTASIPPMKKHGDVLLVELLGL